MSNFSSNRFIFLVSLAVLVCIHSSVAFSNSPLFFGKKSLRILFWNSRRWGDDVMSEQRLKHLAELKKEEWVHNSVEYYSKVMRDERRKGLRHEPEIMNPIQHEEFMHMAIKHYFALRKIKDGKPFHAERIYRNIIDELSNEEEGTCDHTKLAVTTLLLALLLQRLGDFKGTRSVFLNFFRIAIMDHEDNNKECVCSAKVLQAYALFEMKRGNSLKSLEIVNKAVKLDDTLAPILKWKQFRDAMGRTKQIVSKVTS